MKQTNTLKLFRWLSLLAVLLSAFPALAATITSTRSGNWNATNTWVGGVVPVAGDDVVIANGHTVTATAAAAARSLTVNGTTSNTGVSINGTNSLTVSRDVTLNNPTSNNRTSTLAVGSGSLSVGGKLTLSGGNNNRRSDLTISTGTVTISGDLSVNNARARVIFTNSGILNIGGNFSSGGTFTRSTGTAVFNGSGNQSIGAYAYHHLSVTKSAGSATFSGNTSMTGNLSDNGRLNATSGNRTVTFNGTIAQTILGAAANTTFYRLTLNNAAGLTINHNITVNNRLTLSRGVLTTGANRVIIPNGGSVSRTASGTSNFVFGNLQKYVTTGNNRTVTYEVGSSARYAFATLRFSRVTTAGNVTVSTTTDEHPQIATSGIDQTRDVNRYWTITNSGTTFNTSGYAATFNYQANDRDTGSSPLAYIVRRYTLGTWVAHTTGTRTATSTQASGILTFGDFAVGEIAPAVNHFKISHSGTGVNCQAEPVTITAHNAAHTTTPLSPSVTISLSTSTGHGDWSLQTGAGTLTNSGNGNATYTFNNESTIELLLKDTFPETTNINIAWGTITERSGTASADVPFDTSLTFVNSGFRFIDAANAENIINQTAGQTSGTYYLQAIRTDTRTGACVGVFNANQTVDIELASQCNNPAACIAGKQVAFSNNGVTTNLGANPNSVVTSYQNVSVKFLNDGSSRADFTLNYPDVGAISLHARYNIPLSGGGVSGNYMTGQSNMFVVRPHHFELSAIKCTTANAANCAAGALPTGNNPGAADSGGASFIQAGNAFSVTVTARDLNNNATPNYGQESTPESVKLTPVLVAPLDCDGIPANDPDCQIPAIGGDFDTRTNGYKFANGVATGTSFTWGEVGIIKLTPSVGDGDYLGGGDATVTETSNIGRFIPHHFALLSGSAVTAACGGITGFTYMGQPNLSESYEIEAQNTANVKTLNYTDAFVKATITNIAENNDNGTNLSTRLSVPGGTWSQGKYTVSTSTANFSRPATTLPDTTWGAFDNLQIGVNLVDTDGPVLLDLNMNPATAGACGVACSGKRIGDDETVVPSTPRTTRMRFGRLRMNNAYGSELLPLPVPLLAQYWNGSGFILNTDDSCTQVPVPVPVAITTPLSPGLTFYAPPTTATNALQAGQTTTTLNTPFISGNGGLRLSTPGLGNYGYVDVLITAPDYLQYNWNGAATAGNFFDDNPGARATFGKYKQRNELIYMREIH